VLLLGSLVPVSSIVVASPPLLLLPPVPVSVSVPVPVAVPVSVPVAPPPVVGTTLVPLPPVLDDALDPASVPASVPLIEPSPPPPLQATKSSADSPVHRKVEDERTIRALYHAPRGSEHPPGAMSLHVRTRFSWTGLHVCATT